MNEPLQEALNVLTPWLNDERVELIAAKCIGLMTGYHARWKDQDYRICGVEQFVQSGLYNPETERSSRTFNVAGKLDLTALDSMERSVLFDHKTTSDDIADPDAPFWRHLVVKAQPSHYMLLEWQNGRKVDYAIWDAVRRPAIRPKNLDKKDLEAAYYGKTYFGLALDEDTLKVLAATKRESSLMYAARLADDCTNIRPEWYFQRRQVPRLDSELREHAQHIWEIGQEVINARAQERWPKNADACMNYGTPCRYLGICSGHDTADSGNWTHKTQVHSELPIVDGDGRNLLTNSSMGVFLTCRRKFLYQYELGLEKTDAEEQESLLFGHIWHSAQEAYYLALKEQQLAYH